MTFTPPATAASVWPAVKPCNFSRTCVKVESAMTQVPHKIEIEQYGLHADEHHFCFAVPPSHCSLCSQQSLVSWYFRHKCDGSSLTGPAAMTGHQNIATLFA